MNPVIISTEKLSRSLRAIGSSASDALHQKTCFADLPLQARLLLAVPRVRGHSTKATLVERYVLDSLGRIIDPGPARHKTIESVNMLAEVLLTRHQLEQESEGVDGQWLTAIENLVLCVLCKIRDGQTDEATRLAGYWLKKDSVSSFNVAASALCNAECFKSGGPHVFTPGGTGKVQVETHTLHCSVSLTRELSLGELILLNAIRLRMRTLPYAHIADHAVPMLRQNLALPRIEALLDALLLESLKYGAEAPDIRCLCSQVVSVGESRFLASVASFGTGDTELIASQLNTWLPMASVERLKSRTSEFRSIVENLGVVVPRRDWNTDELSARTDQRYLCEHLNEPSMIH